MKANFSSMNLPPPAIPSDWNGKRSSRLKTSPNSLPAISLEMAHLNLWSVDSSRYQIFPRQGPLIWKFLVFTHTPHGYAVLSNGTRDATVAIAPHRLNGNSLAIADLDRDGYKETHCRYISEPLCHEMGRHNAATLLASEDGRDPVLLTAALNQNDFNEFYVNLEDGIYRFESIFATDPDSIDTLKPWNVEARPLTEKAVQVTWDATRTGTPAETTLQPSTLPTLQSYTVYRAQGEKEKAPPDRNFKKVAEDLRVTRYIDRRVTKDNTYWYTVTTQINDDETPHTDAVAATPREPPQLMRAVYYRPRRRDAGFTG